MSIVVAEKHRPFFEKAWDMMSKTPATLESVDERFRQENRSEDCMNGELTVVMPDGSERTLEVRDYDASIRIGVGRLLSLPVKHGRNVGRIHINMRGVQQESGQISVLMSRQAAEKLFDTQYASAV